MDGNELYQMIYCHFKNSYAKIYANFENELLELIKFSAIKINLLIYLKENDHSKIFFTKSLVKIHFNKENTKNFQITNKNLQEIIKDQKIKTQSIIEISDSNENITQNVLSFIISNTLGEDSKKIIIKHLKDIYPIFDPKINEGISQLIKNSSFSMAREEILNPFSKVLSKISQVYLFGAQKLGEKYLSYCTKKGIKVLGFLDNDKKKHGKVINGIKIMGIQDLESNKDVPIIVTSSTYLYPIIHQLELLHFTKILPYPIFSIYDKEIFPPESIYENLLDDLIGNKNRYISTFLCLEDEHSKLVLSNIIQYRLTLNPTYLKEIMDPMAKQYYDESILPLNSNEVFIDGGGYNGDSTLKFIEKVQEKYNKIYFFEPDHMLTNKAKAELSKYKNIIYNEKALYSKNTILRFDITGGLDGLISKDGKLEIAAVALDQEIKEKITFIKLDVEGAEEDTLLGSKNHIQNDIPKLSISAYHKPTDLWNLIKLIDTINPKDYSYFIRHYAESPFETVIYAKNKTK